jgi:hypothetical protein
MNLCEILKVSELIVPNDSDGIHQALSYIKNTYKNLQRESRQKYDLITELANVPSEANIMTQGASYIVT